MTIIKNFDLNEACLKGTNLIEASAGTGKTYTIASLFIRLILEKQFEVRQILVVTFTEAATEELKERIRTRLRQTEDGFLSENLDDEFIAKLKLKQTNLPDSINRLQEAIRDFDEAAIFTIHGFCKRMLNECAFESGTLFDTELITDQESLIQEIVEDFWRIHLYNASPILVNYIIAKTSPEGLISLLGNKVNQPDLKIIPQVNLPDTSVEEQEFQTCLKKVIKAWQTDQSIVEKILLNDKGLNRVKYSLKSIPKWIQFLDKYLASRYTNPIIFNEFIKFTSNEINVCIKKGHIPPTHIFFELCQDLWEKYTNLSKVFEQYFLNFQINLFDYVRQQMQLRKQAANIQFFDDLLLNLKQALYSEAGQDLGAKIRDKYQAALIDEFQDTDPVQYDIFTKIFHNQNRILFLIGDPKQAIYGFRGADIFAYMNAKNDTDFAYTLGKNWRSDPDLITGVNTLFKNNDNAFIYKEIPFLPVDAPEHKTGCEFSDITNDGCEPPLHIWKVDTEQFIKPAKSMTKPLAQRLIVQGVCFEISRLLNLGKENKAFIKGTPVVPADIAVLVRKNSEAQIIQNALFDLNIPSVIYSTGDIFDTYEALEIQWVLSAIAYPRNERLIRSALVTDIMGLKGEQLENLRNNEQQWEQYLVKFGEYCRLWEERGFIQMFKNFIEKENVLERIMIFSDGERRITNILHILELLHKAEIERKTGKAGLVKWLSEQRNQKNNRIEEHPLRLESDDNAVKLITIHKSKGLEYPIVFCPFTWSGSKSRNNKSPVLFHDENNNRCLTFDLGSNQIEQNRIFAAKEQLAENLRLLYVALTRAKNRCYLVWGKFNTAETSAPAYLFHTQKMETENIVKTLESSFKSINDKKINQSLNTIASQSKGTINVSSLPAKEGTIYSPAASGNILLKVREFKNKIATNFRIASFSSLISGQHYKAELADYDEFQEIELDIDSKDTQVNALNYDIFSFPKGTKPGTCLHEIFEFFDFTETNNNLLESIVKEKLEKYGFETIWHQAVCNMVKNVISMPLDKKDIVLSKISNQNRINELEFYFPLNFVPLNKLKSIFKTHSNPEIFQEFSDQIGSLNFSPAKGFMKGFIDMVFQFNNKFYIVDWKSNFLGEKVQDYNKDALELVMKESFYILQYHIYTLALHQYLKLRMKNYDYTKHFGGIFYLFIRGMDIQKGPEFGIFYDRPDNKLISSLCEILIQ